MTGKKESSRRVIRCCEKRIPERIGGFSHIYAAGAHFYFTLYLIEKRIPFSFLEDAAGMLSRPEKLRRELGKNILCTAQLRKSTACSTDHIR